MDQKLMLIQVYGSDAVPKLLQILARHRRMLAEVSQTIKYKMSEIKREQNKQTTIAIFLEDRNSLKHMQSIFYWESLGIHWQSIFFHKWLHSSSSQDRLVRQPNQMWGRMKRRPRANAQKINISFEDKVMEKLFDIITWRKQGRLNDRVRAETLFFLPDVQT